MHRHLILDATRTTLPSSSTRHELADLDRRRRRRRHHRDTTSARRVDRTLDAERPIFDVRSAASSWQSTAMVPGIQVEVVEWRKSVLEDARFKDGKKEL